MVNIYAPNIGAPQYIRQTLTNIKGETDSNTIIVGNFNTPPTPMAAAATKLLQLYLTLCNPTGGSPPGSSVPVIL